METIHQYRHILDKDTKDIFIKSMKETIKKVNLKSIGFIGVIGSLKEEYSHDVDVLIFPSKGSRLGESIIGVSKFYEELGRVLRKHHERFYPIVAPKKSMQEMIYYIAGLQEGGAGLIPIHSLFFPDYKSFKNFNPRDFQKEIKKTLITLYGKFGVIMEVRNDIPQNELEPYFFILDFEMASKLKTFPRHLIRTSAESLFSYLKSKYGLKIEVKNFSSLKEIERKLSFILKQLDKKIYG